uniref:Glutamic acid-rich protein-like n=1 Tax=Tanacetum cinerariifolium TaxID=118510 RepID=A0A6L2KFF4_TANCI|nr:hypothetical protein [Tanacetum cinerariifolium]
MGYEKPSTKLTFYKAFFSAQWKFFIHTLLHSLSAKRTSWNEFSSSMASALICLSSGQRFNFSKYIFESLVLNVDSSSKSYMYLRFIQLIIQTNIADLSKHTTRYISPVLTQKVFANIRRVGKGFSGVETPLFENMLADRDVDEEEEAQVLDTCSALAHRVEVLENDKAAQQLEIVKLKARVKKLEKINKVKSSKLRRLKKVGTSHRVESSDDVENVFNQGRIVVDMDQDEGIELVVDQEKDAEVEGRHADIQAEIYNIDLDHSLKVLSMQEDNTEVQEAIEVVTTAKLITEVVTAATTQVVTASTPIPAAKPKILKIADAAAIDWNAALDHVQSKEPQYIKRYHGIKKKPQSESEARKNMISYLKNTEGYKMEFFKGKTEEMEKEDKEIIKSINETPAQKTAKRRKLSEEAQEADDLKNRLEIVQDEDDDVFVEATPLAQKVPVVDYQVVVIDNKPKYKIIRADDTHQFYISFTTLLKNFDREDLETLWRISREEIEKEEEEIIKSIDETPAQKAAKRRRLREQAKEYENLKKQLEVVVDEDDDVFIEATPIGRKVPVVNYEIVMTNNKPRYKIIRADDTHQLYTSFITLLKNFDREDLEDLWKIVKVRFSTSKPTNFLMIIS